MQTLPGYVIYILGETTTPDGDISPEEIVELCNMADADTDRLVSGHRVPNQQ